MVAPDTTTAPPLTPTSIEKLAPGEYRDGAAPGLRLRVTPQGTRVFRWFVTINGKRTWITIGRWSKKSKPGHVTLAEAHLQFQHLKEANDAGRLLAMLGERRRTPKPAPIDGVLTVKAAVDDFLASLDRKRPEQARRIFDVDVLPLIGAIPIQVVTPDDVRRVVKKKVDDGSQVMARHILALVKQLFDWAVDENHIEASPAQRFRKPKALGTRKAEASRRILSLDEIPAFWRALASFKGMTPTVKGALRLLLLLGVRSGELRQATWDAVDFDEMTSDGKKKSEDERKPTLTIPPEHQKLTRDREKKAKPWVVPLPPTAVVILKELKALADSIDSRYVLASFAGDGEPLSEKSLNHAMRRLFTGDKPALPFKGERPTPHDLRRTVRSHLEETLGVPEAICERVLNHVRGGVVDTYSRGDFLDARREAILAWDVYVAALIAGKSEAEAKAAALSTREGATVVALATKAVRS